jgi:hypothetical protein
VFIQEARNRCPQTFRELSVVVIPILGIIIHSPAGKEKINFRARRRVVVDKMMKALRCPQVLMLERAEMTVLRLPRQRSKR